MMELGTRATAVIKGDSRNGLPVEVIGAFEDEMYVVRVRDDLGCAEPVRTDDGRAFPLHASQIVEEIDEASLFEGVAAE